MKKKIAAKMGRVRFVSIFSGIVLLLIGAVSPCLADVQINNMQNEAMDVDAAMWDRHNGLSDYKIYTYAKIENGASHIFCYTINANGRKSADLKVSLLANASIYDGNIKVHLTLNFPFCISPMDLTPSAGGNNFFPKVACDPNGTALIVWEYQYKQGNLDYKLILGTFVKIDARTGAVTFLDQNEPFVVNSFPWINVNGSVGVYTFAPEIDYIRNKYFCVAYNEYVPSLNNGERLIVKLVTSETNPPKVEWNGHTVGPIPVKGKVFEEKIPCLWAYATRYYNVPLDINGKRNGCINKGLLCNKVPSGILTEIYLVYNNIGFPSRDEPGAYDPDDTYLVILETVDDYSGFAHEVFRNADHDPGFGEGHLNERPNDPPPPDLNTRAVPQRILHSDVKYIEKPLIAVGKEGLVIGLNFKCVDEGTLYYDNIILKDTGRHFFLDIYNQHFIKPVILRDLKLDADEQNLILIKQVIGDTITLRQDIPVQIHRVFDLVELRGIIIPNGENNPVWDNKGKEFIIYTGSPAYIFGGEILEDTDLEMKYIYCNKGNPLRSARNAIQSGRVYTTSLGMPGGVLTDFVAEDSTINLTNRLTNGGTVVTLEWDLLNVDVNWLGGGMIFPAYSTYILLSDGAVVTAADRTDETTAEWHNASHRNYVCAAYAVVDLGYGIGVKSNTKLFLMR